MIVTEGRLRQTIRWMRLASLVLGGVFVLVIIVVSIEAYAYWEHSRVVRIVRDAGDDLETAVRLPFWGSVIPDAALPLFFRVVHLNLFGGTVDDDYIRRISGATSIESLIIAESTITNASIRIFATWRELRLVSLNHNPGVTDESLQYLASLQNLQVLSIDGTSVTDAGIMHLASMSNLRLLSVIDTAVTKTGSDRLHATLPDLRIVRTRDDLHRDEATPISRDSTSY